MVLAMEVLEHLEDPKRGLKELVRVRATRARMARPQHGAREIFIGFRHHPGHVQHWSQRSFVRFVSGVAEVVQVWHPCPGRSFSLPDVKFLTVEPAKNPE